MKPVYEFVDNGIKASTHIIADGLMAATQIDHDLKQANNTILTS